MRTMATILVFVLISLSVLHGCSAGCDTTATEAAQRATLTQAIAQCQMTNDASLLEVRQALEDDGSMDNKITECTKLTGYNNDFDDCIAEALDECSESLTTEKEDPVDNIKDLIDTNYDYLGCNEKSCVPADVPSCIEKLNDDYEEEKAAIQALGSGSSDKENQCKKLPVHLATFEACVKQAMYDCSRIDVSDLQAEVQERRDTFANDVDDLGCTEYIDDDDNGAVQATFTMVTIVCAGLAMGLK